MGLKLNKFILIITFFTMIKVNSQVVEEYNSNDTVYSNEYFSDTTFSTIESSYYNEFLHYSDTAKESELNLKYNENLNREKWKKEITKYKFEETQINEKPEEDLNKYKRKSISNGSNFNFKYVSYFLALVILIIFLIKIIPNKWNRNIDIGNKLKFEIDELDHESIKEAELNTPLNNALNDGNYKEAYRIKYLQVLQLLIKKNLILYSKEKTNFDYLIQLNSKPIYDPFKKLTLNFDGIWYGETPIDEKLYQSLIPYFNEFENLLKN